MGRRSGPKHERGRRLERDGRARRSVRRGHPLRAPHPQLLRRERAGARCCACSDALAGLGGTAEPGSALRRRRPTPSRTSRRCWRWASSGRPGCTPRPPWTSPQPSRAALIAAYTQRIDHSDLVVMGARSGPGDGGTVPFRVAEQLGLAVPDAGDRGGAAGGRPPARDAHDRRRPSAPHRPCAVRTGGRQRRRLAPACPDADRPAGGQGQAAGRRGTGRPRSRRSRACLARGAPTLAALEGIDRRRESILVAGDTPRAKAQALFDSRLKNLLEEL